MDAERQIRLSVATQMMAVLLEKNMVLTLRHDVNNPSQCHINIEPNPEILAATAVRLADDVIKAERMIPPGRPASTGGGIEIVRPNG